MTTPKPNNQPAFQQLEQIRIELAALRERIAAIRRQDKLWEGWLTPCEGGITCVLTCAAGAVKEMKSHHSKWIETPLTRPENHVG